MTLIKRRVLDHAEVVEIYNIIKLHLRQRPDKLWEYEPGWSDAKVFEALKDPTLSVEHVARTRAKTLGELISSPKPPKDSMALQVAAIMATLIRLEAKLDHLTREMGAGPWRPSAPLNGVSDPAKGPSQAAEPPAAADPESAAAWRPPRLPQRR